MRVSLNELETRYARAFEGLGAPAGLALDAARIVARHDVWGLQGLEALCRRLADLDGAEAPQPGMACRSDGLHLDAGGASLLYVGPQAVDLLELEAARGGGRVWIESCSDSVFACGLAAIMAERGLIGGVRAQPGASTLTASVCHGEVALDWTPTDAGAEPADGTVQLLCGTPYAYASAAPGDEATRLSANLLSARAQDAVALGVALDAGLWQQIYDLGARFLVADSEASRRRGAGGAGDGQ